MKWEGLAFGLLKSKTSKFTHCTFKITPGRLTKLRSASQKYQLLYIVTGLFVHSNVRKIFRHIDIISVY